MMQIGVMDQFHTYVESDPQGCNDSHNPQLGSDVGFGLFIFWGGGLSKHGSPRLGTVLECNDPEMLI